MNISEQHLAEDVEYFKEQEDLHIQLRDGCDKESDDYNYHQKSSQSYYRAAATFEILLEEAKKGV